MCSSVFVVLFLMEAALLFLPYKYDNLVEVQTLVPNLSMEPSIKANLVADMTGTTVWSNLNHMHGSWSLVERTADSF